MIPVSVTVPQFSADAGPLLDLARDPGGIAGVFVFDHLVPIDDPHRPVLEAAATLGALAATAKCRVGSLVLRATMRPPAVTAAIAHTLSSISSYGAVIGLGIGDRVTKDEADRYGMPTGDLEQRLALLVDTIGLIRRVAPDVAVWVGGRHDRVRAVAAELADGWNCWSATLEEFQAEAEETRSRADRPLVVSWGGTLRLAENDQPPLEALAAVADELVLSLVPNRRSSWDLLPTLLA